MKDRILRKLRRLRTFFLVAVPVAGLLAARPCLPFYLSGVGLAIAGQALRLWAAGYIRKERELAVEGPYAWVRNPLYAGSLLISLGWAAMSGRAILAAVILLAYAATHWPTILAEEPRLRERFGAEYDAYCRRVPRLFPSRGVWRGGGVRDVESARAGERNAFPHSQTLIPPDPSTPHTGNFSWHQAIYTNREGKSAVGVTLLAAAYGIRLWW